MNSPAYAELAARFMQMADEVEDFDPTHEKSEGVALGLRMAAYELLPELRPTDWWSQTH